jgi:hypothetical protein
MSKAKVLFMVFLVAGLLSGCKKAEDTSGSDGNTTTTNNTTGSKLVDKVIDASTQDVSVNVQGKINVVIPKGMAPSNTTITIEKIDAAGLPKDDKFTILDVYDVKLSSGSSFSTPLKVTINYDASKAPTGKFRNKMGAAYLDETAKVWRVFSDCVVDTINKTMTFPTNHLTKLSTWGWTSTTSVYTDYYSTTHFNIYWQAGKIYTNTEYLVSSPTAGSTPDYIKDIGKYMEASYNAFQGLGLTVPTLVKVDVYLTSTLDAGVDGQATFLGYIYLNNKIKGDGSALTVEKVVPMVCAHEFLHYVQDYYYMQLFSDYTTKWWLEATATQADRMVWPKLTNYESLLYADKVKGIMDKSWDDCNADPDWYTAGCFLAYLSSYRTGNKASIAELIKLGGSNTSISMIRTTIDTYLKTTLALSSQGIGLEYLNFIRWAFESSGDIKISSTPPSQKQSNDAYVRTFFAPLTEYTKETSESFPRLSVRSLKIYHDLTADPKGDYEKGITITGKDLPNEVFAYVYTIERIAQVNTIKMVQQLKKSDVVKLTLPKGSSKWIEVLLVNTSKDDAKNYIIEVKSKIIPSITSISPVKLYPGQDLTITGTSFGGTGSTSDIYIDGIKINSSSLEAKTWTDTKIVVTVPNTANTGVVYVKIKEDVSNSVNLEVDRSLPTKMNGYVSNLTVTTIDQDNKTKTVNNGGPSFFITGSGVVTWSGNSFSYTYTKEPDAANSYKEVETLTGTLSADHQTLLTLTYKRSDVAKLVIPGFTREMRRDWEFSISNVPKDSYAWLNHLRFTINGTAFNNYSPKYIYSDSQVETANPTVITWSNKLTGFQANTSTSFYLYIGV